MALNRQFASKQCPWYVPNSRTVANWEVATLHIHDIDFKRVQVRVLHAKEPSSDMFHSPPDCSASGIDLLAKHVFIDGLINKNIDYKEAWGSQRNG